MKWDDLHNCFNLAWTEGTGIGLWGLGTRLQVGGEWIEVNRVEPERSESTVRDDLGEGGAAAFVFRPAPGLKVRLQVSDRKGHPGWIVEAEVANEGGAPVDLGDFDLLRADVASGSRIALGPDIQDAAVYTDSGSSIWCGAARLSSGGWKDRFKLQAEQDLVEKNAAKVEKTADRGGAEHVSTGGVNLIYNGRVPVGFLTAALSFSRVMTTVRTRLDASGNLSLFAVAQNFHQFRLMPGASIACDPVYVEFRCDPHDALEHYGDLVKALNHTPIWDPIPMAWISWYAARLMAGEEAVIRNARFLRERFAGYDFKYIHCGHGWQWQSALGKWDEMHAINYPHGMDWLARELDKYGLKLGLFCAFLLVTDDAPLFREHPEWLLRDRETGELAVREIGIWTGGRRQVWMVDLTRPEVKEYFRGMMRRLVEAGVKYWCFDFFGGYSAKLDYYDKGVVRSPGAVREALKVVTELLDEDDFIYPCSCPTNAFLGLCHTTNSACDVPGPGARWRSVEYFMGLFSTLAGRWYQHKRFWITMPDAICVGEPGTVDEARLRATMSAMTGGALLLSEDLPAVPESRLRVAEQVMPPFGEAARPVDLFERPFPNGYPQVWRLPVATAWGRWDLVACFNVEDEPCELEVSFASLKLDPGDILCFEFWDQHFLGVVRDSLRVRLLPRSVKLFKLLRRPDRPCVLSTDLHFTQGGVELPDVTWDEGRRTLTGTARRVQGAVGSLVVWRPDAYRPVESDRPFRSLGGALYTVGLAFQEREEAWRVRFET